MSEADQEQFRAWYQEQIEHYLRVAPRYKELAKVLGSILTALADQ
jgi:hypothetical protein